MCTTWKDSSNGSELFGEKPLVDITICGVNATALLDTGSQTTIIPVKLLKRAVYSSVDLDEYTRIPGPKLTVRDASGNVMKFLDTVRVAVTLGEQLEFISAYVGKGPDEVIILGTNALEAFNLKLVRGTTAKREPLTISSEEPDKDDFNAAVRVKERTYVPFEATHPDIDMCTG
ncbi:retroviral aspartyl protease [Cooperia oncophora]